MYQPLAQVYGCFGAGEEKWWGPAPAQCTEPRFTAQVPPQKYHLRQECCPPAPENMLTCASKAGEPVPFRLLFLLFCLTYAFGPFDQRCRPSFPARPGIFSLAISTEPCPLSFRPSGEICPEFRQSARGSAKQPHGNALSARCDAGCGAPRAEIGPWRTLSGHSGPSSGC